LGLVESDVPILRWFDFMGAQRHLKCLGIFSRLNLRDGKPGYLADIPLVVDYLLETSAIYAELESFHKWLLAEIIPRVSDLKQVMR
jgi:N-acetylmuramate 1-kinase